LPPRTPSVAAAAALGALHGPAELLPVSSSGHVALAAWWIGWEGDPELRKSFEVALHAGTAAALLLALRDEVGEAARGFDRRRAVLVAGSFAPPAVAGLALERPIERRLGTPATIAAGLLAGAGLLALGDARGASSRARDEAGLADALALGLGQAAALWPGVSRNGATLAAARARGFARPDAWALSRHVALPVIVGATVLKGVRLARRGLPRDALAPFAAGVATSFASTLAAAPLARRDPPVAPFVAYRTALAAVVLRRVWKDRRR
jgi:undecaprenyl-diphosphatase